MTDKINVLYQHDNNYAVYGGVSIYSLLKNNSGNAEVHIYMIDPGLDEIYKLQYQELADQFGGKIHYIDAAQIVEKIKGIGIPTYRGSYATYYKLFAVGMLPDSVGRLFYMDSDTVVPGDLSPLFTLDMQGNAVGMCYEPLSYNVKDLDGFKKDEPFYCGGTILFDISEWKKQECERRIVDYAVNVRCAFFAADQNLLNIVLKDQITMLPLRYDFYYLHSVYDDKTWLKGMKGNAYYTEQEIKEARKDVGVSHFMRFLGEEPWHQNSLHPSTEEYDKYLKDSPWKDCEKKPASSDMVFRMERLLYKVLPRSLFLKVFMRMFEYNYRKTDRLLREGSQTDVH